MPVGSRKVYDSPVVRRAKKTGYFQNNNNAPDPKMRRSISLNQVDVIERIFEEEAEIEQVAIEAVKVESCAQYLEEHPDEILVQDPGNGDESEEVVKISGTSPNYGTLPKAMRKNISRSLVPKMRRMFEKARSCDPPDLPQIRIRIQTDSHPGHHRSLSPPTLEDQCAGSVKSDGTESVSSFVAVSTEEGAGQEDVSLEESSSILSQSQDKSNSSGLSDSSTTAASALDHSSAANSGVTTKKGFVNKCVKKVKNIMGSSGKLSQKESS